MRAEATSPTGNGVRNGRAHPAVHEVHHVTPTTADSMNDESPARRIDARIAELGGWRGELLARLRALITHAEPAVVEEWKWDVPVWSRDGILCTGEAYKAAVKLTFPKGASLDDPAALFNASLDGAVRRAIDFREGAAVDEDAFRALIRAAARLNAASSGAPGKRRTGATKRS